MKNTIEDICKKRILGGVNVKWLTSNLCFIEYKQYNIAFDIVLGVTNIGIDIVLRANADKKNLVKLYPTLQDKHKHRLFTIDKYRAHEFLAELINKEYLRIVESIPIKNKIVTNQNQKLYFLDNSTKLTSASPIKMFFCGDIINFGDLIGPWLASKLTDRPVLNVKAIGHSDGAIIGVGSIIGMVNPEHKNCKIWGSGLITDKNFKSVAQKLKDANLKQINAVRGKVTESLLTSAGFNVDPVYGDPALIFSDLYEPKEVTLNSKKVLIPHYIHYDIFKKMNLEGYHIVNVKAEPTTVIDQIANADRVISTSLHGLILAQSYGIPWVHLHLLESPKLIGDAFKFSDYFTTLDTENVAQEQITLKDLNQLSLDKISDQAKLPKYADFYSSNAIIEAFHKSL